MGLCHEGKRWNGRVDAERITAKYLRASSFRRALSKEIGYR